MHFIITLTLTIGGSTTLDVNPTLITPLPTSQYNLGGTAWIPHVITYDPTYPSVIPHEIQHAQQWTALGPAFPIAYALTGGRAFEDYKDMMWTPPVDMIENCPLLRVGDGIEFLPCYRF